MKAVLGKYRLKEDATSYGGSSHVSLLQQKIEDLNEKLTKLQGSLNEAEAKAGTSKEGNVEQLV